ncbi:MAG: ABC transporter permease subunit [Anaerolineales bacterium]|nr:ABC transporter permease subunit [Anaerolineales bacterium]
MNAIWILTKLTFREAMRRRIMLAGLVLGIAFIVIYSLGLHFILEQVALAAKAAIAENPSVPQSAQNIIGVETMNGFLMAGLYAVTFLSITMAALLGADTLAGEINSGTIQTIVTKPIRRADVVLGKWLGFAGLLGLYVLLMGGGVVLSMFLQTGYTPDNLLAGLLLIYMEAVLIMSVTVTCSAAFPALATGGIVFGLYGLSFIGGWIEQFGAVFHNQTAVQIGIFTSLIIPSESLWRRAAFEMQTPLAGVLGISPFGAVSVPSVLMVAYAGLYLVVTLVLSIRIFQKRDL